MSDHADNADKVIAATVDAALRTIRRAPGLVADGHCHFCESEIGHPLLFCDVDCRDDYQREQAAIRRAGKG
ncbi:MAG: hypothetical protein WBG17_00685 [Burkholderiaceae bacterium]